MTNLIVNRILQIWTDPVDCCLGQNHRGSLVYIRDGSDVPIVGLTGTSGVRLFIDQNEYMGRSREVQPPRSAP